MNRIVLNGKLSQTLYCINCMNMIKIIIGVLLFLCGTISAQKWESEKVYYGPDNLLKYPEDSERNVIPDFSYAGYKRSEEAIPNIPVVISVSPVAGDNTQNIQKAIDSLGALPLNSNGFRGALFLNAGVYNVWGTIYLKYSGVVLRGAGDGADTSLNTIIYGRGNIPEQRSLIVAGGGASSYWRDSVAGSKTDITTGFVQVGSRNFSVASAAAYNVGDNIIIYHPCTADWLKAINYGGTHETLLWQVGEQPIVFNRRITSITGNDITIDAPVFNHLDRKLSQSFIYKYSRSKLRTNIGIENIRIDIETKGGTDEDHIWQAVELNQLEDSWVKNCTMLHFGQSGIITNTATRITVDNCNALDPISIITGERRYNFNASKASQLILFKNCTARNGRHHFVSNGHSYVSGIVFLDCKSIGAYNSSEGHRRWSQGLLFDNITESSPNIGGYILGLYNRGDYGTAHGWAAVHSVAWNYNAAGRYIIIQKPPTAQNYAIGCSGAKITGITPPAPFAEPEGYIEGSNKTGLFPRSLFIAQLEERLGKLSAINTHSADVIIPHFELHDAFPNPFNPSTNISYTLNKSSEVHLEVFDSLGKKVADLVQNFQTAGAYNILFNASRLSSGLYFYRLSSGGFSDVRKMYLIK